MNGKTGQAASELQLNLNYQHGSGYLAPYFEGLLEGRAIAGHCPACGRKWFPPRPVCPHDRTQTEWSRISGNGVVVSVTSARTALPFAASAEDYKFVLVAMDETENAVFGRMQTTAEDVAAGTEVRLAGPTGELGHPSQAAQFTVRGE